MPLNPSQRDLLRLICGRGSVPRSELDGRSLRPLEGQGLASDVGGIVRATPAGIALNEAKDALASTPGRPPILPGSLSPPQEESLRQLLRETGPVLEERVDGRVLRALETRGLVRIADGWVTVTDAAAEHLARHASIERTRRARRARHSPPAGTG